MSSRGSYNGGVEVQPIPAASRKMVQSLKEIVNCPEPEIYATLKECNMDPNEAVNRLLTQDPFREVKSKRDKKKENKDSTDSRPRGASGTSNRGARSGTDRYAGRGGTGGSTQFSSSDSGALHGKPAYRKENGTMPYSKSSVSVSGMAGNNSYRHIPALSDSVPTNKASTENAIDTNVLASQPSSGYQSVWVGVPGQKSLADIVKMGRPQSKAPGPSNLSHKSIDQNLVPAPPSNVSEIYPEPDAIDQLASLDDEWPLIEQPQASSLSSVFEPQKDSQLHLDQSNLSFNRINQHSQSETDEDETAEDASIENHSASYVAPATIPSGKMQDDSSGDATPFEMYKNMDSYQPRNHAFQDEEVEDVGASVSSETANLQQLSIHEEDRGVLCEEDSPSVVIPDHLQVQTADCSHLSFGSFGSGLGTAFSGPFTSRPLRSNMEEAPIEAEAPVIGHSDSRNPEYCVDKPLISASDANMIHRTSAVAGSFDSSSASQSGVLKQENSEVAHGNQCTFPSSTPGYAFENSQQLNNVFNYSQTSSQMQNLTSFSSAMAYTNSLPSTLLAGNVHPARESELPYSPFPLTQPMPPKYSNTVSSISGSTISMTEALKTGFSSSQPTPQNLSATNVATGPALPQHLAVHPYSQPTLPLGPFANMISYPFLPQSYTYMPSGFQQAFAGNSTYHQSLAAVLPQYKNSVSVSSLPQSAAVASGYGAFGSSTAIPGNYAMNPQAGPAGSTMGYDDVLSSQYKDSNHLISLQQNENAAVWLHGPGSRTVPAVPASTYYSFQGQNQQPAGFRQGLQQPTQNYGGLGYPNYYQSQTGISLEHQPQNPRDGSLGGSQGQPKQQSQQLWQNSY